MTADEGTWVYAVAGSIREEWFNGTAGVAGRPVRAVTAAGLAAAVTRVSLAEFGEEPLHRHMEDLAWLEATARAHHHVIEIVARHGPVIPMRLATVYYSDAGVADLLARRQAEFADVLAWITARTEWGVKAYAAQRPAEPGPPGLPRQPGPATGGTEGPAGEVTGAGPADPEGPGGAGRGAAYLRRRRMALSAKQEARQAAISGADAVHAGLAKLAVAAQLRPLQGPQLTGQASQMVLNGAYLVDDARSGEFTAAAQHLASQYPGIRMELTGPWPPYSFAAVDQETAVDRGREPGR